MKGARRPTLIDVADRAGVSKSTVSRVINERDYVNAAVRETVLEAMRALGYRPNSLARSLRTQRSLTVGFVVPTLHNDVYAALADGTSRVLEPSSRTLLVSVSGNDAHLERKAITNLLGRNVEGLILSLANERTRDVSALLQSGGVPIVLIDRDVSGVKHADRITVDHRSSVIAAARRLKSLGHRRVAVIAPPDTTRPGREVARAFTSVYPKATVVHRPLEFEHGRSSAAQLLGGPAPPTAFLGAGTQIVAGVVTAIREARLAVPDDVSVIGYDESPLLRLYNPPIDAIVRDIVGMGTLAGQLLLSRLDEGRASPVNVTVTTHYEPGSSVGPPP